MSKAVGLLDLTFIAEADLRLYQYRVVTKGTAAGTVKICGASDVPLGVLQNTPNTGEAANVRMAGTSKVYADGAFAYGDQLAVADAYGEVDTVGAAPVNIIGIALETAGKAHVFVEMFINRAFVADSIAPAALTAAATFSYALTDVLSGDLTASVAERVIGIARGAGVIDVAGFTLGNTGADGTDALSLAMQVYINGVAVLSTPAAIAKAAADGACSLVAGTGVTLGVINASARTVALGDLISIAWTLVRTTPEDEVADAVASIFITPKVGA